MEEFKQGDYISGFAYCGKDIIEVEGWVDNVYEKDGTVEVAIQCDGYNGQSIYSSLGKIKKLPHKQRPKCLK